MTANAGRYWNLGRLNAAEGCYVQPQVCNPPQAQNADNARHAIWHLGHEYALRRYSGGGWDKETGLACRGEYERLQFWAVICSGKDEHELMMLPEGMRSDGVISIRYDPFHPQHENVYGADGIHLQMADDRYIPGGFGSGAGSGFPDVLEYNGELWMVIRHSLNHEGGNEELNGRRGGVGCAIACKWRDGNQQREATVQVATDENQFYELGTE